MYILTKCHTVRRCCTLVTKKSVQCLCPNGIYVPDYTFFCLLPILRNNPSDKVALCNMAIKDIKRNQGQRADKQIVNYEQCT